MIGNAHCVFHTVPERTEIFNNVKLTAPGDDGWASLDRYESKEDDSKEILRLEGVRIFIVMDEVIELEGFARVRGDSDAFHQVLVAFFPTGQAGREVVFPYGNNS